LDEPSTPLLFTGAANTDNLMDFPIDFCPQRQRLIEEAAAAIVNDLHATDGESVIRYKASDDEQIKADLFADRRYGDLAHENGGIYFSEESQEMPAAELRAHASSRRVIYVADPIDGSSEFVRAGPHRSPLTTAIMALRGEKLCAAAVGDIWAREVYALRLDPAGSPMLLVTSLVDGTSEPVILSPAKQAILLEDAMVAAYAPSHRNQRIDLLFPMFKAAAYVHNNGGHAFALRVVTGQSPRSYSAAMEPIPTGLWEHIGPILACAAGATTRRLDGSPLELDPTLKQTSITAGSPRLADQIQRVLSQRYQKLGISHRVPRS
jgi:fructose-1,6-bisphosphatase/inositol monophosphatase family enzyme